MVEVTTVTVTVFSHGGSKNEQGEGEGEVERKRSGQHWWWEVLQLGRERRAELAHALSGWTTCGNGPYGGPRSGVSAVGR